MTEKLNAASFVAAGPSARPTRLLRRAAGLKTIKELLPFLRYISEQHRGSPDAPRIALFLDDVRTDSRRLEPLSWSPIFRSWFQSVQRVADWDCLDEGRQSLLEELWTLVFNPREPQEYLADVALPLASRSRYMAPDLDWVLDHDDRATSIDASDLVAASEVARDLSNGSATIRGKSGAMTVSKSVNLAGETYISNFHPRLKVRLSGTNQRDTGVVRDTPDWETYPDTWDKSAYMRPFHLMKRVWPEEFADQLEIVKAVVPMQFSARSGAIAFTVSSHQGAIFVTARDERRMLEWLLHEKAHVKQRYVEHLWPLLEEEQSSRRFEVPWRRDPRPIVGIFEGIFVFLQVLTGLIRCHLAEAFELRERILEISRDLEVGLNIIDTHAQMTPEGRAFYEGIVEAFSREMSLFGGEAA